MSSQKQRASPAGTLPARRRAVGSCASRSLATSRPGSHACAALASATTAATLPAAPFARLAPGLSASSGSLAAGSVSFVPSSSSAGSCVAPVAATSAARGALALQLVGSCPFAATTATSHAVGIAAALPRLVSGEGQPTY
jgi:hypothetical protein